MRASVIFVAERLDLVSAEDGLEYVDSEKDAVMDSAITVVKFTDLYATGPLVKPVDTAEGVFGDSTRVLVYGFLQDEAGNLGGNVPEGTGASWGLYWSIYVCDTSGRSPLTPTSTWKKRCVSTCS